MGKFVYWVWKDISLAAKRIDDDVSPTVLAQMGVGDALNAAVTLLIMETGECADGDNSFDDEERRN